MNFMHVQTLQFLKCYSDSYYFFKQILRFAAIYVVIGQLTPILAVTFPGLTRLFMRRFSAMS